LDSWMQSLAECKVVFFRLVDCHIWMAWAICWLFDETWAV
jgi:hypothetical protein